VVERQVRTSDHTIVKVASQPIELSWFNVHILNISLFVCTYKSYFQSLMDVQPLWHLMCTNKTCFAGIETRQKIIFQIRISFLSYPCESKKSQIFLSADPMADLDSRCKPGVFISCMEFDFCFAIENSRSFKTVICSTNSSSHCLSRDAEHICLTAFRWRCDEVEMRGTCLEAQQSMQTKVVINSWKLYYNTEDTFTRNRLEGFFDIRRNEKVLL